MHEKRASGRRPPAAIAQRSNAPAQGANAPAWASSIVPGFLATFAAAQAWILLRPGRVGDYLAESDFYGAYAEGARLIQAGHWLPARYGVTGPAYEAALALAGVFIRDLFAAAGLVALLAALACLWAWGRILGRTAGAAASACGVLLLATNPHFFRYAHAATPDMLALGLQAVALALLFAPDAQGSLPEAQIPPPPTMSRAVQNGIAGLLLAIAFLTRYNTLVLLPVAAWALVRRDTRGAWHGRALAAALAAGFAVVVVPWILFSALHGGEFRFQFHHNVAAEVFARAHGQGLDYYEEHLESQFRTPWDVLRRDPPAVLSYMFRSAGSHLLADARDLLGWPAAMCAAIGAWLLLRGRLGFRVRWLAPAWALLYLSLVPLIYSVRYSLTLLPFYAFVAAAALTRGPAFLPRVPARLRQFSPLVALIPAGLGIAASVSATAAELANMPVATREAGEALRALRRTDDRVLARKAHVAYYAGLPAVMFPHTHGLAELAAFCRREGVRWLFYSEREGRLRPEYWFLADTTATPGLVPRFATAREAAVLYEVTPNFGQAPDWVGHPALEALHRARAAQRVDSTFAYRLYVEAQQARGRGEGLRARQQLEIVCDLEPTRGPVWLALGNLDLELHDPATAGRAFEGALRADPSSFEAHIGLGWVRLFAGDEAGAAREWRPRISQTDNAMALEQMVRVFTRLGDPAAAREASARLSGLPPAP